MLKQINAINNNEGAEIAVIKAIDPITEKNKTIGKSKKFNICNNILIKV